MNILSLALDLILEAPSVDAARVYNEIRSAVINSPVGVDEKENPTYMWLGGITQNRGSGFGKVTNMVRKLIEMEELGPDSEEFIAYSATKDYRDAFRYRIALEKLLKFGLITREERGRYVWPSTRDKVRLGRLSELRTYLTKDFHAERNATDWEVQGREAKYGARSEAISNLPAQHQAAAKLYSELTVDAFNLLSNLTKKRGPKEVAAFRATVNQLAFNDSPDLLLLRKLGFLNEENLLNRELWSKLTAFMAGSTQQQQMAINKDLGAVTQRMQHHRQRTINAAGKGAPSTPEETEMELGQEETNPEFADDMEGEMTDEERRAKYSRIRNIHAGTKNSTKNDRAGGYKHTYTDIFQKALD